MCVLRRLRAYCRLHTVARVREPELDLRNRADWRAVRVGGGVPGPVRRGSALRRDRLQLQRAVVLASLRRRQLAAGQHVQPARRDAVPDRSRLSR